MRRLDGTTTRRGFSIRLGAPLPVARPRQHLRERLPGARQQPWHRGSHHSPTKSLAKSVRRASHRLHPPRMPRPRHRPQRSAPQAHPLIVLRLLSRFADAHGARSQRTGTSRSLATGPRSSRRCSAGWRFASPLHTPRGVVHFTASLPWSHKRPLRACLSFCTESLIAAALSTPRDAEILRPLRISCCTSMLVVHPQPPGSSFREGQLSPSLDRPFDQRLAPCWILRQNFLDHAAVHICKTSFESVVIKRQAGVIDTQ